MVRVHAWDNENYVMLSDGYLPSWEQIREVEPLAYGYRRGRQRRPRDKERFPSRDHATAWLLTRLARRAASFSGHDPVRSAFETWILSEGDTPSALYGSWLAEAGAGSEYRLMVHRQERELRGTPFWEEAYRKLSIRHRQGKYAHLKRIAEPFLSEIVTSYRKGHSSVQRVMDRTGHRYVWADGLRNP